MLNGDDFSSYLRADPSSSLSPVGLEAILGFSERLTGGGPGFVGASLLNSPDLRGGGGEGG